MSSDLLRFRGYISGIQYQTCLRKTLKTFPLDKFNINTAPASGIVRIDEPENSPGYSKWVSPKRARSYP